MSKESGTGSVHDKIHELSFWRVFCSSEGERDEKTVTAHTDVCIAQRKKGTEMLWVCILTFLKLDRKRGVVIAGNAQTWMQWKSETGASCCRLSSVPSSCRWVFAWNAVPFCWSVTMACANFLSVFSSAGFWSCQVNGFLIVSSKCLIILRWWF